MFGHAFISSRVNSRKYKKRKRRVKYKKSGDVKNESLKRRIIKTLWFRPVNLIVSLFVKNDDVLL